MYHLPVRPISELKPYSSDAVYFDKNKPNKPGSFYILKRGRLYQGVIEHHLMGERVVNMLQLISTRNRVVTCLQQISTRNYVGPGVEFHNMEPLLSYHDLSFYYFRSKHYVFYRQKGSYRVRYKQKSIYSVIFAHRFLTP